MKHITKYIITVLFFCSVPFITLADVSDSDLLAKAGSEWIHVNGDLDGTRHSTLNQINASNASNLEVKWVYSTGGTTNAQGTPIYHDGILFLAQNNSVHAIDAASGKRVWIYDHDLPEDFGGQFNPFFTGKHKGVSIYGKNIYFMSNECTIVALNYKTGDVNFSFKS